VNFISLFPFAAFRTFIASRWRPAFSSHLVSRITGKVKSSEFHMEGVGLMMKETPKNEVLTLLSKLGGYCIGCPDARTPLPVPQG